QALCVDGQPGEQVFRIRRIEHARAAAAQVEPRPAIRHEQHEVEVWIVMHDQPSEGRKVTSHRLVRRTFVTPLLGYAAIGAHLAWGGVACGEPLASPRLPVWYARSAGGGGGVSDRLK